MANKNTYSNFAALSAIKPSETKETALTSAVQFDERVEGEDLGDLNDAKVERIVAATSVTREGDTIIVNVPDPDDVIEAPIPTLNDRDPRTWTDEELEAYITKQVSIDVYYSTVVAAIAEMRIRNKLLPRAWSLEECQTFLTNGVEPAKTSKGAWVSDVTRATRREHEWSTQELESWALGEIQPEGQTIAAGLAIELKQRLKLTVPSVDVEAVIKCYKVKEGLVVAKTAAVSTPAIANKASVVTPTIAKKSNVTINPEGLSIMNQSYIEGALKDFHSVMEPGRAVTRVQGGQAQKLLKEVITYAYSLPDPGAATAAMKALFDHFAANREPGQIFEDTYAFRFIEDMLTTPKEQEGHAALLTVFLAYADPMTELREQTDVMSLIKGVPTKYQSRILEFFSKV